MPNALTRFHRRHGRGPLIAAALAVGAAAISLATPSPVAADDGDTIDGRYSAGGVLAAGSTLELDVTGRGGTASNAAAVSLNITVTQTAGPGHATVYPCGSQRPTSSSINYGTGMTIANAVVAKVGSGGKVCIHTSTQVHMVVDVDGYFPAGSGYRSLTPARLLDTRRGQPTVDGRYAGGGIRKARSVIELDVRNRGGVGNSARAVTLNLTATQTGGAGFATVYPCDEPRPLASTINYGPGATIANGVTAKVGGDGRICVYTHARAHLIVDVDGAFASRDEYRPLTPARVLDTRPGEQTVDGRAQGGGRRTAGTTLRLDVTARGGTASNATAVSLNLTATQTGGAGFVTVYPCGSSKPAASTLNYGAGATIANGMTARVGDNGEICIFTSASTHLVVDVNGFFPPGSTYRGLTPARLLDTRSPAPPPPSDVAAARSLELLNALRARHGVAPVTYDPGLSASALGWSQEMSRSGFRHSNIGLAENIAWHSQSAMSPTTAAETFHVMWENSSGHFRNMIDPRWTRVGIGLHAAGSGWYGTHIFDR
ncbi:MAG: CAP domain-containing protein [Ilumatobacter sp.]|uniref:CAP domain-containing protein n=1 Tax=Ilumatobacter sp. TaxID=1967498 RepID=UPI00261A2428|nr:CAP domain-containing protein [Ilumatobacter sp.]MDJ0771268.1 CAP domain-containing protein [Ilumatobacter sp.]